MSKLKSVIIYVLFIQFQINLLKIFKICLFKFFYFKSEIE